MQPLAMESISVPGDVAVGSRVFAVRTATEETVESYGTGVYLGEHPCHLLVEQSGGMEVVRDHLVKHLEEERTKPIEETHVFQMWEQVHQLAKDAEVSLPAGLPTEDELREKLQETQERPVSGAVVAMLLSMFRNPLILLDNGGYVWGMESWWSREEDYLPWLGDRKVKMLEGHESIWRTDKLDGVQILGGFADRHKMPDSQVVTADCGHKISLSPGNLSVINNFKSEAVYTICADCLVNDLDRLEAMVFSGEIRMAPGQLEALEKVSPMAAQFAREVSLGGRTFTEEEYEQYAKEV